MGAQSSPLHFLERQGRRAENEMCRLERSGHRKPREISPWRNRATAGTAGTPGEQVPPLRSLRSAPVGMTGLSDF